jgi:hypothetical protein
LCSSTTISLKALSNDLLSLVFIISKLRGLTYCPIKSSKTSHPSSKAKEIRLLAEFRITILKNNILLQIDKQFKKLE